MPSGAITVRKPTATFRNLAAAPIFNVNRPMKGLRVGIRYDQFWRSWLQVVETWSELLRKDGAEPVLLQIGEHVGEDGQHTKTHVEEWARSVDCAVVGLAN